MGAKENRSKMYISRSDGSTLKLVYPIDTGEVLPSNEAAIARGRTDVSGIYFSEDGVDGRSGYFFREIGTDRRFHIVTDDWPEELWSYDYEARLTGKVEDVVGRGGLTIIRY